MSNITISSEMWFDLMERVAALERQHGVLGPSPKHDEDLRKERESLVGKLLKAVPKPVDRSAQVLISGEPVPEDRSHTELKPNGQQKDYVVLTADERGKGFVRPYRDAYRHLKCGKITTMSRSIAETYARDPFFYSGTFCTTCGFHFPIGEDGEFTWHEMDGTTGPKVGT